MDGHQNRLQFTPIKWPLLGILIFGCLIKGAGHFIEVQCKNNRKALIRALVTGHLVGVAV